MTIRLVFALAVGLAVVGIAPAGATQTERPGFEDAAPAGETGFDCGDLFYDDGTPEDAIFFGGGQAGESDHFLGVRFELADFSIVPGSVALTGFCVSNQLDLSAFGGPWPNEVVVVRDLDGLPDLDHPQRQATMLTGDGRGAFELQFESPWRIDEPVFWILVRGDPVHAGEDFNVESDQSPDAAGKSWLTDRGLDFMFQTEQNLMIRANIESARPDAVGVPLLSAAGLALLAGLLLALGAVTKSHRRLR
ncbi:MAG: hypothetical protein RQ741_13270 [Wenzhouxiangellaceae bacterium]|nr:hypothetical protein [Wenzhouxiangellaceae bacterium]